MNKPLSTLEREERNGRVMAALEKLKVVCTKDDWELFFRTFDVSLRKFSSKGKRGELVDMSDVFSGAILGFEKIMEERLRMRQRG